MSKTKQPFSLKLISCFLLIHGIFYLLGINVALFVGVWNSYLSFLFGNILLHKTSIFIPVIIGTLYIFVAWSLLKHRHGARVGAVILCSIALFMEFPIGTILSIVIIVYLLRPSLSSVFKTKINRKAYRAVGITLFLVSFLSLIIISGVPSGIVQFATYDEDPYRLSVASASDKIVGFENEVGSIDILVELTAPLNHALEQQTLFISEVDSYIIYVKDRMVLTSNSVVLVINAVNLLNIAENENVLHIYTIKPTFVFHDSELQEGFSQSYSQLGADILWAKGVTGKGITVAVLDTGIKEDNPYLQRGNHSIVVGGLHLYGEYVHNHGTMVASCIASQNLDVLGVAPDVNLLNVEIFRYETIGGIRRLTATNADVLRGFEYVVNWKMITGMPVIISCSWGVSTLNSKGDADICTETANRLATQYNIPVIASAGNYGPYVEPYTSIPYQITAPSGGKNVLAVGAVDSANNIAGFSSIGPYYTGGSKPDVVAPGVLVSVLDYDGTTVASGTSFSCPYVSGISALLLQDHKDASSGQIYDSLRYGATDLGRLGFDAEYGHGLVNADASLAYLDQAVVTMDLTYMLLASMCLSLFIFAYPYSVKKRKAVRK